MLTRCLMLLCGLFLLTAAPAAATPLFAQDEHGDGTLLFRPLTQFWRPLEVATSVPDGRFSALTPIAPRTSTRPIRLEVDEAGGAVAAWLDDPRDSFTRLMVATREPGGGFATPVAVSSPEHGVSSFDLSVNADGDAVLVWDDYRLRYALRPAGGSFGAAEDLPGPIAQDPRVVMEAGGGVLFIGGGDEGNRGGSAVYRRPGGGFDEPVTLEGGPSGHSAAVASNRRGDALLAWVDGQQAWTLERPAGGAWEPRQALASDLPPTLGYRAAPAALDDAGDAVVLLIGGPLLAFGRSGHGEFGAPQTVADAASPLALDMNENGVAALVFTDGARHVRVSYGHAGAPLAEQRLLDTFPPRLARSWPLGAFADVAVTGDGRATVMWERSDGDEVQLRRSTVTSAGVSVLDKIATLPTFVQEQPPEACTPSGGRVLARSARAVVVSGGPTGSTTGCLLGRGIPLSLNNTYPYPVGGTSQQDTTAPVAAGGPFAAAVVVAIEHGGAGFTEISVVDLRDEWYGESRFAEALPKRPLAIVRSLRVAASGSVAWIACREPVRRLRCRRGNKQVKGVYAWGPSGRPRLVGRGPRIDPHSLRLRAGRLVWHEGRRIRSVSFR